MLLFARRSGNIERNLFWETLNIVQRLGITDSKYEKKLKILQKLTSNLYIEEINAFYLDSMELYDKT